MRHRPGGVGLRSERPGVTGAMGSLMSWDPWPRPVARATVETQECTQIGENGPSDPFWVICVHCCAVVDRRGDAGVYTDRRKWPLGAVLGHSCTLLRREGCVGWHERPSRHGVPAAPLGGPPLPWPEKQALREWHRRQAGVFTGVSTYANPRRAVKYVDFATVWGQGHTMPERTGSGTANFIEWVRGCCA